MIDIDAGSFVVSPDEDFFRIEYNISAIGKYLKQTGREFSDLTEMEIEQFRVKK